eukprot:TRINITY_DN885_c1_g1_i1.p1 TRINITY_DN885_c1_g1~~TRINITY_DN885_c1_g1_i1.p1  ORF type:complete len:289 (+),score=49.15 TRINITY_DN885_c1_g1_i1:53-919(+)
MFKNFIINLKKFKINNNIMNYNIKKSNIVLYYCVLNNIKYPYVKIPSNNNNNNRKKKKYVANLPLSGVYKDQSKFQKCYKSAGILPYSFYKNKIYFLLGKEIRKKNIVWSEFGGKIEPYDKSAAHTAFREFNEETDSVFESQTDYIMSQLNNDSKSKTNVHNNNNDNEEESKIDINEENQTSEYPFIWNKNGKYLLYLVNVKFDSTVTNHTDMEGVEADKLKFGWVEKDDLLSAIKSISNTKITYKSLLPISIVDPVTESKSTENIFHFFATTLSIKGSGSLIYSIKQ